MLDPMSIRRTEFPAMRLGLFGPMCVGKTFIANLLFIDYSYERLSFAAKLKEIAEELFFVDKKDARGRKILQDVGTALRNIDENAWVNPIIRTVSENPKKQFVVDDVRYPNEYKALVDAGFLMVKVSVPERVRQERISRLYPDLLPEAHQHASETALLDYRGDVEVESADGMVYPQVERLVNWSSYE